MNVMPTLENSKLYFKDSFVFVGSMIISAMIIYPIIGIQGGIAWSSFAVLCTYSLYNAKPDRSNLFYVFFWMCIILSSIYIGKYLQLTIWFYLYLLILAYCYYIFFGRDPVFDRAIQYIIILSTMGTTMPHVAYGMPLGGAIGTFTALTICHYMLHKNHDLEAFRQSIFSIPLLKIQTHIIPSAIIYSFGMFACLWLPLQFGINKNFWATLTFILILTPKAQNVISNTILRLIGNLIAVSVLFFILEIPDSELVIPIALFAASFILPLCFGKNLIIVAFGVTCYSLVLVELAGYWHNPTTVLLLDRVIETIIGGMIAILASMLLKLCRLPIKAKLN